MRLFQFYFWIDTKFQSTILNFHAARWKPMKRQEQPNHHAQQPTKLGSCRIDCPMFKPASRCFCSAFICHYWIDIDEVLASVAAPFSSSWNVKKVTCTILKNQPGFGANIAPVPYSKVYQGASFEPVSVTIGCIVVNFLHLLLLLSPVGPSNK